MTWTNVTQAIVALAATGALAVSIYNTSKIEVVHVSINSRMDQMLELTRKASKAEGVKQERDRSDQIQN